MESDLFSALLKAEAAARDERRRQAGVDPDLPTVGLALSGGGIRCATFSLGLLRALTRSGVLSRIDMISSVSGGGYTAATLGRLFSAGEPGATSPPGESGQPVAGTPSTGQGSSTDTQAGAGARGGAVTPNPALARVAGALCGRSVLIRWLRNNGRYLAPAGAADVGLSMVAYLRAAIAIQVELAALAILVGVLIGLPHLLHYLTPLWLSDLIPIAFEPLQLEPEDRIWQSIWFPIALSWLLLTAPFFIACYWSIRERSPLALGLLGAVMTLAASAIVSQLWSGSLQVTLLSTDVRGSLALLLLKFGPPMVALSALLGALMGIVDSWRSGRGGPGVLARCRSQQTRRLHIVLGITAGFVAAGLLDRLSWSVLEMLWSQRESSWWVSLGALSMLLLLLRSHAESLLKQLDRIDRSRAMQFAARLLPWSGMTLAFVWLVLWIAVTQHLIFDPSWPAFWVDLDAWDRWWLLLALAVGWIVIFGRDADGPNATSLHDFYRTRLVRAYVSVANPRRFPDGCAQASTERSFHRIARDVELIDGDDVDLGRYRPEASGGPAHLLNVCINHTRDGGAGLFDPDRKGLPMSISHHGFDIGTDQYLPMPAGDHRDAKEARGTLGRWIAVSGAAVAPGQGARTVVGSALMMFLFGIRLGYWWKPRLPRSGTGGRLMSRMLCKPGLYLREAFARFAGTTSPYWYLSDGGHFDNTGAYALLKRRYDVIALADCGADPDYRLRDIENLVRKARIDLDARIEFYSSEEARALFERLEAPGLVVASPYDLGRAVSRSVLLARVTYAEGDGQPGTGSTGTLLVFKPTNHAALDLDLQAYASKHPDFPQQPTSDQFFDEAQWESYQHLGEDLGAAATPQWLDCVPGWRGGAQAVPHPPSMHPAPMPAPDAARPEERPLAWRRVAATAAVGGGLGLATLGTLIAPALDIAERLEKVQREASQDPADLLDRLGRQIQGPQKSAELWSLDTQRDLELLRRMLDSEAINERPRTHAQALLRAAKVQCKVDIPVPAVCDRLQRDNLSGSRADIYGLPVTLERLDYWRRLPAEPRAEGFANVLTTPDKFVAVAAAFTNQGVAFAATSPVDADPRPSAPLLARSARRQPVAAKEPDTSVHFRVYRDQDRTRAREIRKILCDRKPAWLAINEISNVRTLAERIDERAPMKMRRTTLVYHGEAMHLRAQQVRAALAAAGVSVPIVPLPSTIAPIPAILELWIGVDDIAVGSPSEQQCNEDQLETPPGRRDR